MAYLHLPTASRPAFMVPITAASSPLSLPPFPTQYSTKFSKWVRSKSLNLVLSGALTLGLSLAGKFFFLSFFIFSLLLCLVLKVYLGCSSFSKLHAFLVQNSIAIGFYIVCDFFFFFLSLFW